MTELPFHIPSPLESFTYQCNSTNKFTAYIKRDDKIHPLVTGNKWRKLQGHFDTYDNQLPIVTCGGPHSNHLLATAGACHLLKYTCIGIVKGQHHRYLSARLQRAQKLGMELIFITNHDFRQLQQTPLEVLTKYDLAESHYIPMGGDTRHGETGCTAIIDEILAQGLRPDTIAVPAGTGRTCSAMLARLDYPCRLLVFPAISHPDEIKKLRVRLAAIASPAKFDLLPAHRCRFGKTDDTLRHFIEDFHHQTGIQLDEQYNGKMMEIIVNSDVDQQDILIYHSGGTLPYL